MKTKNDLNFSFKGARDYVHGTDIFDQSIAVLQENTKGKIEHIELAIHKMTDANLCLMIFQKEQAPEITDRDIAVFKFQSGGQLWQANLAGMDTKASGRRPYDEKSVVKLCEIDEGDRSIVLKSVSPFSDMEVLVAMTKALHLRIFPEPPAHWVFCRWKSARWPLASSLTGVGIRLIQALGTRLTKSEIIRDGEILGHIYFSARNDQ